MNTAIDFIGDIHGYCDALCALLKKLGYVEKNGAYRYPGDARTVVFLGDYVDRGPKIRETLKLVRAMRDAGSAVALMGNHEFNMLAYHHRNGDGWRRLAGKGDFLQEHSEKKRRVHEGTLRALEPYPGELGDVLEFLKTLPFYLETETFRAVHACFDFDAIAALKQAGIARFNDGNFGELIHRANDKDNELGNSLFGPFEIALKGPEMKIPEGKFFVDKDGTSRYDVRVCWWENAATASFDTLSMEKGIDGVASFVVSEEVRRRKFYGRDERPVFFGHYWLKGVPKLQAANVCCLDYSVAKTENDGGRLACYRFDGERQLDADKFVYVSCDHFRSP